MDLSPSVQRCPLRKLAALSYVRFHTPARSPFTHLQACSPVLFRYHYLASFSVPSVRASQVSWGGTRVADGGDPGSLLAPLDAKLRAELLARNARPRSGGTGARVLVLDRLKSLTGLGVGPAEASSSSARGKRGSVAPAAGAAAASGAGFPSERLCGHGLSGPVTDLHARFLAAALCSAHLAPNHQASGGVGGGDGDEGTGRGDKCALTAPPDSLPRWVRAFT